MFLSQETSSADTKYNVASILSSMANGQLLTPTSYSFLNSMTSGTGTTPTLTPTSLASLEQTFIELQSVPSSQGRSGGCEPHTQSGFVPPLVDPSSRDQSQDSFESDSDWEPVAKRGRGEEGGALNMSTAGLSPTGTQRKTGGRRSRHEKLNPEEDRRRAVRRERNKVAAAKCRQRRVDHTNCLVEETEKLEMEQSDLEQEIQSLKQQRDQLEFLLQAHVPICKVDPQAIDFKIKTEPSDFALTTSITSSSSSSSHLSSTSSSSRPMSLALAKHRHGELPVVVSCAGPGIPLTTPTSGLFTYTSLDSLVDGSTGLTPLTAGPTSCASQLHRSESENGAEPITSPTLISL